MIETVSIECVYPNYVAMRAVDRESAEYLGLCASIQKHGFLGAITVRKNSNQELEIIDGLHRYQAARDAGLMTIPVDIVNVNDAQLLEMQIMKSVHRIETKPIEYARHLKRMLVHNPHTTMDELAARLGKSSKWIRNRLSLMRIEDARIQEAIDDGRICLANAYALAKLPANEQSDWIDRAETSAPVKFLPCVNSRVRELRDKARFEQIVTKPIEMDWKSVPEGIFTLSPAQFSEEHRAIAAPERIVRIGWDNVMVDGRPAYLRGDTLVAWTDKCWTIYHPVLTILANTTFKDPTIAMKIVERYLCADITERPGG